ncbi:MAG: TniB family NTP-binding protein [Roseobacter sp.]
MAEPRSDPLNGETEGLMGIGQSGNGNPAPLMRVLRVDAVLEEFKVYQGGNTLYITVAPEATIKKLAEIILANTGYDKVKPKLRAADAWEMAQHRFGLLSIKALIIDESHHIFGPAWGVTPLMPSKHLNILCNPKTAWLLSSPECPAINQLSSLRHLGKRCGAFQSFL